MNKSVLKVIAKKITISFFASMLVLSCCPELLYLKTCEISLQLLIIVSTSLEPEAVIQIFG
jgi:hypothetical protein